MRDKVRFLLGEELVEVGSCDPTLTLLDWLRLERGLTGTKEGCAEGDCGACTVAIGRLQGDCFLYEAINSCIRFLPSVDGCHVLTVEHLGGNHPIQEALVENHGSQCGFCTPGFVMSLFCLGQNEGAPDRDRVETAIAGNLCRCTGYRPIVDAALAAGAVGHPPRLAPSKLAALRDDELVEVGSGGPRSYSPATLAQLETLLVSEPDAILVAGATDVGLWVTKEMRRLETVVFLGRITELQTLTEDADHLVIGAGVTLSNAQAALTRLHPHLGELMRRFGGEQVRNAGTVGGNIANGSPIGDLAPALMALDASLVLRSSRGRRELPVERFFLGYGQHDRQPGEFLERVIVPKLRPGQIYHVSKVSKRFDEDISAVCGAFRLTLNELGTVMEARLAFGGMAATSKRARNGEAALLGLTFDERSAADAAAALAADFTPIDDWRASARYRMSVAGNLLRRFAIEHGEPTTQTRIAGLLGSAYAEAADA